MGIFCEHAEAEVGTSGAEYLAEADAFFAKLDENLPSDTPTLSDEALTRDALYEGRG